MKKEFTMIAIALLALSSCTENELQEQTAANAVAIRMGQSVQGMTTTRAVVNNGSTVTAKVLMVDGVTPAWAGVTAVTSNTIVGGSLTKRANVSTATFVAGSKQAVGFNPTLYYDNAGKNGGSTTKSHLVAVSPDGTLNGTVVTFGTKDGTVDAMYAPVVDAGSESSPASNLDFIFAHKTTQLSFEIKITSVSGGEWDNKIVGVNSILVKSVQVPEKMDAADGRITWTTAADCPVPNISSAALTSTAVAVGDPIMVQAKSQNTIDVELSIDGVPQTFSNIPLKNAVTNADLVTAIGKSHKVVLNVNEPASATDGVVIAATATVTPWVIGDEGKAELN